MNRLKFVAVTSILCMSLAHAEGADEWVRAEERTANGVLQVWVQSTKFNWLEPYKSPTQGKSAGSGFFIDSEGHLLTNYHVVEGALKVFVCIAALGRRQLSADIVGVCPDLDIALLKLTPESKAIIVHECGALNVLEFGDSDALYSTQPVLAIGFPLGMRTVKCTAGNVAGRDFLDGRSLIHITAPISPGNSGGPLVDREGKVVGINTGHWENAQNYNYIVPIQEVRVVLNDLYTTPLVRVPEFGIGANRGTEAHARSLENPVPSGIFINEVLENSFEKRAGIEVGDMLYGVTLKGKQFAIDEYGDVKVPWRKDQKISLFELLSRCRVGDEVVLTVYRNGCRIDVPVIFEMAHLNPVRSIFVEFEPHEIDYEMFGGLVVMQLRENHLELLSKEQRLAGLKEFRRSGLSENRPKPVLVVTSILVGSEAALSECLMPGLILDKVNGKTVTTLDELRSALMLSKETGAIAIATKDKLSTVLDLEKVLTNEGQLAYDFKFPITKTVRKLMESA